MRWLLLLRWGEAAGQASVIVAVDQLMGIELPLLVLLSLVALVALSNAGVALWVKDRNEVDEWVLASVLGLDVLLLTALLYFSGGSFNPFNFLYLVHVTLAAVVLHPRWAWALLAQSLVCFGALFLVELGFGDPSAHMHHADQMQIHLQGMWVACAVAAGFIVYFVVRISRDLRDRDAELATERERAARTQKLASLATLAAGAAHELSTPLSTIALVAHEMNQAIERGNTAPVEDIHLIQQQVARCRGILDQMSTEAGASPGEVPVALTPKALVEATVSEVVRHNDVEVTLDEGSDSRHVRVARSAAVRALRGLIDNACDASPPDRPVTVSTHLTDDACHVEVRDHGAGMSPDVLSRAGEPFYTTKEPGHGMGLGLFLARAIAEHLGGSLALQSREGEGTVATMVLPLAATTDHIATAIPATQE